MVKETEQDIKFLLKRSMKAGCCNFTAERDTGISSNSIVAIAYGFDDLSEQILPKDLSDFNACKKMWEQLPEHRKTDEAKQAFSRAARAISI